MHVYIGGAHNGKRDYVKKWLIEQGEENVNWIEGNRLGDSSFVNAEDSQTTVIAGVEKWLAETNLSEQAAIDYVMNYIGKDRHTVIILTDIGRGIVPMDAGQRKLRDACGRLYQRLMAEAGEVTRIWYGLAKTLKKRGDY
ncbi:hypothetical protein FQ087_13880 [Sporosarcina sp. ANT_H38]|uniref:bifunctional adenosylcobinamide kinase/adenosylcobinamide-phosphate guanylyltransferase n=1 Tax=Sporosarcina sp. ANT_H38 TaxID=2597358 RepID=UPI0011F24375|nr:bifunctional adenosylcobinamide kinase/adenosylcobinamide-phosphate guanylyltransferase [Sporosarcina sp. ANT_H38]KAA0955684.1 hypothetical protein FQ087_13880 [Sporosarcina sp. ANT_H38]